MMLLLLAALPALYWDGAPGTAPALRDTGATHILVPAQNLESWKAVPGITAEAADPGAATKLVTPSVDYRANQASATREPWLNSNGWMFLRQPHGRFYYDAPGAPAALAAAEAFCYGAGAIVRTDAAGLKPFTQMLDFLRGLSADDMPAVADIGFIDDGSRAAGEIMNLMARNNLLFKIVAAVDPARKLTVRLGSNEYPVSDATNRPDMLVHQIRANLTDEKRSLRIYGSSVVVGRLTGSQDRLRVHLLNYAGASRIVDGLRIRVRGRYPQSRIAAAGVPEARLLDYTLEQDATEFTLTELKTYAVIDLSR